TRKTVKAEFKDIIYDPEAEPKQVLRQLERLNRDVFADLLQQRDDLTDTKISKIADRLEAVRQDALEHLVAAIAHQQEQSLRQQVESYLRSARKSDLTQTKIRRQVQRLLKTRLTNSQEDTKSLLAHLENFS